MKASARGRTEVVAQLIQAGASLDIRQGGTTAIGKASYEKHIEVTVQLLQAGAIFYDTWISINPTLISLLLEHGLPPRLNLLSELDDWEVRYKNRENSLSEFDFLSVSHDPKDNSRAYFCLGVKNEQAGNLKQAEVFYKKSEHPAAYHFLGKLYANNHNFKDAIHYYELALQNYTRALEEDDFLSPLRLVTLIQKLVTLLNTNEKHYKTRSGRYLTETQTIINNYLAATKIIYPYLISKNLCAHLTSEQWSFLAVDATGNPYFETLTQSQQFVLSAAKKAEETAQPKQQCNLLVTSTVPEEKNNFKNLALRSNTAYVRSGKKLFYVDKTEEKCTPIDLVNEDYRI